MEAERHSLRLQRLRSAANALAAAALTTGVLIVAAASGPVYVAESGFLPGIPDGLYLLLFGAGYLLWLIRSKATMIVAAVAIAVSLALPLAALIGYAILPPQQLQPDRYMSPNTAILGALCSLSLFSLWAPSHRAAWAGQGLAIAAACALLVFAAGEMFGEFRLYELSSYVHMSRFSFLGFTLCIAGLLLYRPEAGAVSLFISDSTAGTLLRRQTVPLVLVPLVVAWLINLSGVGYTRGVELSLSLGAIVTIFLLLAVMSVHAAGIRKLEASRTSLEQTLLGTERNFRLLVERIAHYAVFMVDPAGRVASWNAGAERLHGYPAGEVVGHDYAVFFSPEDLAAGLPRRLLDSARDTGQATHNGWLVRKNGSRFLATCSLTAVRDDDGRLRGFSDIIQDVTEQRLAQAEREELLLRMQTLIDTASEAIIVIAADGTIESFNPAAEGIFGYSAVEALGREIALLSPHPEVAGQGYPLKDGAAAGHHEVDGRHKSGRVFPLELTVSEMRIQGQVKFVVLARDITERKQTEDALRESQERLQLALEGGKLGVWDVDVSNGRFTCSPLVWGMLGYVPDEVQMPLTLGLGLLHPDDETRIMAAFEAFVSGRIGHFEEEFRLRTKSGEWLWVLSRARIVRRDGAGAPRLVAGVQLDISDRKVSEETARIVSMHDSLTGLPNRALIYEFGDHLVSAARRAHHKLAVLFIDLDRFKQINDTYGHQAGDELLREVARRIATSVRGEDLAGRLAGDEFVAILSPIRSEQDVTHAADKILQAVAAPCRIGDLELQVSPSVGIALYPEDAGDMDTLIHFADAAMYIAKQRGRNNYQFYTSEISQRARKALAIERQLRDGVDHAEFRLHYQPIVSAAGNRVEATEALLRWQHDGIQLTAQQFLATAETAGLMGVLGDWCVGEACRQQARWKDFGMQPIKVAINISPTQFRQYNFVERLRRAIIDAGADPAALELELTETAFDQHVDEAAATLGRLRDMGLSICLDDFGTGQLSLGELGRLPIDKLKVDRSLIAQIDRNPRAMAVTEAAIAVGKKLGIAVAIGGIESTRMSTLMTDRDCDLLQGNSIGEPMPADRFARWVEIHDEAQRRLH